MRSLAVQPAPFEVPTTISKEARKYFEREFSPELRDRHIYPEPNDLAGWREYNRSELEKRVSYNAELRSRYEPTLIESTIAGIPVLDIRPRGWADDGKVILYTHGGGYVGGVATDALDSTLPLAEESRLRVISVSYTLAPQARFPQITDETTAVARALLGAGHRTQDIAILGDSAGGGLAAATALKVRDQGLGLLAGVVLWSPWADLTGSGDTYLTLPRVEPFFRFDVFLCRAALAYAGLANQAHPYASPVFGNFTPGYPPTLIQAGTRELLLSDSVRLYQKIAAAGIRVKLDLYEGMWHVFQFKPIDSPEARRARQRTCEFLWACLG
jgi:monoterpene epsilon-lactone hydrolase